MTQEQAPVACKLCCDLQCPTPTTRARADCYMCKAGKEHIAKLELQAEEQKTEIRELKQKLQLAEGLAMSKAMFGGTR